MEAFMIKTGFYAVATRKEAERRAMAQWERDEMDRVKDERKRQKIEREKQDRQHYRQRLEEELRGLRAKERETGVALHGEKVTFPSLCMGNSVASAPHIHFCFLQCSNAGSPQCVMFNTFPSLSHRPW